MMASPSKQAPFPAAQHVGHVSKQPTTSPANPSSRPFTRAALLLAAAAVCHALAGQTLSAMKLSEPWWLGHAASLIIRAYGADIVNRLEAAEAYRFMSHVAAVGLGWALDRVFSVFCASD